MFVFDQYPQGVPLFIKLYNGFIDNGLDPNFGL